MEPHNRWSKRISAANRFFDAWETLFKCKSLEKYYEGFHWNLNNLTNYNPYTINEFYSIIKIKIATYLFSRPHFLVSPVPGSSDYDLEFAAKSAQLKEDLINTIIEDPNSYFKDEVKLAFLDSIFRFGIMEVGYAADWIRNPRVGKPLLKSHRDFDTLPEKDKILREPDELPANERIYFKRIHAKRFRIGGVDAEHLSRCNWVGYYDFVFKSDLLSMKGLKWIDKVHSIIPNRTEDYDEYRGVNDEDLLRGGDVFKIWHIWDLRSKERLLILDSQGLELWKNPFKRLPLFDFRWDLRTHGWYPIPPSFQWLSPQDEINEAREQMRAHRRRFTRKFQALEGTVDAEEIEKFEHGPDGTIIIVKRDNAIQPIQDANIGAAVTQSFVTSSDDLNKVSGTSSEQRGQADRTTATQARLIDIRSGIREDYESSDIQDWMILIARETLLIARDKLVMGTWVKMTSDPGEHFLGEVQENKEVYQWVTSEDLSDSYDFRIKLDVVSMSPVKAEEEKKKFLEFLSVVNNFPQIILSPILIREAAYRCGYRNEKVIKEMMNAALVQAMGQAQMNSGGAPQGAGSNTSQQITEQQLPQTQPEIENQIGKQLLVQ